MRKRVASLFAIGLPLVALFAFFIHAKARDASRGHTTPNTPAPASPIPAVEDTKAKASSEIVLGQFKQDGITIESSLSHLGGSGREANEFVEGDYVRFRFRITDASGAPVKGVFPAAWLL